jgi:hypothetical protein
MSWKMDFSSPSFGGGRSDSESNFIRSSGLRDFRRKKRPTIQAPKTIKTATTIPMIAPRGMCEPLLEDPNGVSMISPRDQHAITFGVKHRSVGCAGRSNVEGLSGCDNIPLEWGILNSRRRSVTEPLLEMISPCLGERMNTLVTLNENSPELGWLVTLATTDEFSAL